jgi:hypothetical protein
LRTAFDRAVAEEGKVDIELLTMQGMSGRKYRFFINNLIESIDDARYLEIGVWKGSTLCAAIYYKNTVRTLAIDNWSLFDGPAASFFANLGRFKGDNAAVSFMDSDFRAVSFTSIGMFNVYLFDGPYHAKDQRDGIVLVQPALDEQFVLIVDDWNEEHVRQGTLQGIRDVELQLDFTLEIRTTLDNSYPQCHCGQSDWHNGYLIAACSKRQQTATQAP